MAKSTQIENEHLVTILNYLIIGIIWYFADENMKKSSLVKFHAKQALNFFIILVIANIILAILNTILAFVLWPLALFIQTVFTIVFFILWLMGLIYAINKEKKRIPLIGIYAEKYLKF